jgi:hypothetical protein
MKEANLIDAFNRHAINKNGSRAYHLSRSNLELMLQILKTNPIVLEEMVQVCLTARGIDKRKKVV